VRSHGRSKNSVTSTKKNRANTGPKGEVAVRTVKSQGRNQEEEKAGRGGRKRKESSHTTWSAEWRGAYKLLNSRPPQLKVKRVHERNPNGKKKLNRWGNWGRSLKTETDTLKNQQKTMNQKVGGGKEGTPNQGLAGCAQLRER